MERHPDAAGHWLYSAMIATRCLSCYRSSVAALLCVVLLTATATGSGSDSDGGSWDGEGGGGYNSGHSSVDDVFFPSSVHTTLTPRGHLSALPAGLQIAVHNAVSVAVNGREYAGSGESSGDRGDSARGGDGGSEVHKLLYSPIQRAQRRPWDELGQQQQRYGAHSHPTLRLDEGGAYGGEDGGDSNADSGGRAGMQYALSPPLAVVASNAMVDRAAGAEDEMRRLAASTVGAAEDIPQPSFAAPSLAYLSQPPPYPALAPANTAASTLPLTLVDERNRLVARGGFQEQPESAPRYTASQPSALPPAAGGPAVVEYGEGTGRGVGAREVVDRLLDYLSARLGQRIGGSGAGVGVGARVGGGGALAAADNANTAQTGGVEIALTDAAGRVVGAGTYFPHSAPVTAQPPLVGPGGQQSQQQQQSTQPPPMTDAIQAPVTHPTARLPQQQNIVPSPPSVSPAVTHCYGNEYDSFYCRSTPHSSKKSIGRHHYLPDTEFLPATSPIYTTDEEAAVERSRSPYYPASPGMVVVEPQRPTLYSDSDITQSLATSLAVFPPVAPFMARPRSAAAAVAKQAVEAAGAAAPAMAAGEEEAEGVGGGAAPSVALSPALETLGTEFRDQA